MVNSDSTQLPLIPSREMKDECHCERSEAIHDPERPGLPRRCAPRNDENVDALTEVKLGSRELFKGHFLHAFCDQVKVPDGASSAREYIVHPGAVMIVALLGDACGVAQVVLERQFRYPLGQVMIEFPAGKLEPGEDSQRCAQRELLEETGYQASQWARAGVLHPAIAYSTEFIDIWFARGLTPGQRQLDQGEFLDVFTASSTELLHWCRTGQVTDGKTLTAALWLQNILAGAWALNWQAAALPVPAG